jgi:uncharacterized protein involved in cysteine biosynthesis
MAIVGGPISGFLAPFRGLLFVARHGLWGHLALPLLLNIGLAVGAGWLAVRLVRDRLGTELTASAGLVADIALFVLAAVVGLLLFLIAQPVISAPFVDLLSEKVERIVRGQAPSAGLFRSAWQAMLHGSLKTMLYLLALILTFGLGAVTGIGGAIGAGFYALFLAFDGFDYPLARRAVSFGGKWRYLVLHPGQTLGYCVGASVLYLVPLAALVAPAFAAVGATLAYLDSETHEGRDAPRVTGPGKQGEAT